jgi:hypothetical protein
MRGLDPRTHAVPFPLVAARVALDDVFGLSEPVMAA